MEVNTQHVWLLTGIINQCDINPGRIAITLGQVVGTSLVKVTLLIAEFIHPYALYSLSGLMRPFARAIFKTFLSLTPANRIQ